MFITGLGYRLGLAYSAHYKGCSKFLCWVLQAPCTANGKVFDPLLSSSILYYKLLGVVSAPYPAVYIVKITGYKGYAKILLLLVENTSFWTLYKLFHSTFSSACMAGEFSCLESCISFNTLCDGRPDCDLGGGFVLDESVEFCGGKNLLYTLFEFFVCWKTSQ